MAWCRHLVNVFWMNELLIKQSTQVTVNLWCATGALRIQRGMKSFSWGSFEKCLSSTLPLAGYLLGPLHLSPPLILTQLLGLVTFLIPIYRQESWGTAYTQRVTGNIQGQPVSSRPCSSPPNSWYQVSTTSRKPLGEGHTGSHSLLYEAQILSGRWDLSGTLKKGWGLQRWRRAGGSFEGEDQLG